MTVDSVRRVADRQPFQERTEDTIDIENISFEFGEIEDIVEKVDGFPFSDPKRLNINFEYESEAVFGSNTVSQGEIQIRLHSQLMVLNTVSDRPRPSVIFDALMEALQDGTGSNHTIQSNFQPKRKSIIDFIRQADNIIDIRVLMPNGELQDASLDADIDFEQYPIDRAKLRFQTTTESGDQVEATVLYSDDQLHIRDDNPEIREYVIQCFETAFSDS